MTDNDQGMRLQHVFYVYRVEPTPSGLKRRLSGRVLAYSGALDVLSDYDGLLDQPSGPMSDKTRRWWESLQRNPYVEVVPASDIREGRRPELVREAAVPTAAPATDDEPGEPPPEESQLARRPPSVFEYQHAALGQPVRLEVSGGSVSLNGHPLTAAEQARIMSNVQTGAAVVRYLREGLDARVAKAEGLFADLAKIEPHLATALDQLRGAVKAGHVDPQVLKALTGEIFRDTMTPTGNKKAFSDFLSRPRRGIHIRMDGNDFGQINKIHGHERGDEAIGAMGRAMRDAMDEEVGRGSGKLFRIGGDEFHAFVPTHEHAASFMRNLRQRLEAHPPVGGTHALSVSAGFSDTPHGADAAMIEAKKAKKAAGYQLGQAKTHAYSGVPGFEGHVPVSPEQLPIHAPPRPPTPLNPGGSPAGQAPGMSQAPVHPGLGAGVGTHVPPGSQPGR